MQHPFDVLKAEYLALLSKAKITRASEAKSRAAEIIKLKPHYAPVSEKTGVPIIWLMAINERESGSSLLSYLGNGQRLNRVTTIVPKGRGPWADWPSGAVDGLTCEHLVGLNGWDWPFSLYHEEAWNGFGPRDHGKHTGYLWSGTDVYTGGKYVADGIWNPNFSDPQLGTVPIMLALIALDGSLELPDWPKASPWPDIPAPIASPVGHDGGAHGVVWLQDSLNTLLTGKIDQPLKDDGSYGRMTAAAVRLFQQEYGLQVDGLAGPITLDAIQKALTPSPLPQAAAP